MKKFLTLALLLSIFSVSSFALNSAVYVYGSGQKIISSVPCLLTGYTVITATAQVAGLNSFYVQNVTWTAMTGPYSITAAASTLMDFDFGWPAYGPSQRAVGLSFSKGIVVDFGTNTIGAFFY